MKKLAVLGLLASSFAHANITDLNYMALDGQKNINVNYVMHSQYYGTSKADGTEDTENTTKTNSIKAGFTYGINKEMAVEVILTNRLNSTTTRDVTDFTTTPSTTTSTDTDSDAVGLEDPVIMFGYRAYQKDDLTVDVNGGLLLSLGAQDTDNAYRGGHALKVNSEISKSMDNFEIYGAIAVDLNMQAEDADGNDVDEGSTDTSFTVKGQYMIMDKFYANLGVSMTNYGSKGKNIDPYSETYKTLGLKYAFSESAMAYLDYSLIDNSQVDDIQDNSETDINRAVIGFSLNI
jgi:hypothetical protein